MDEWVGGGWVDGCAVEWINKRVDGCKDGWIYG